MPLNHAVAWINHHTAQVVQIDAAQAIDQKVSEHAHYTRQHGSNVHSEHEFFADACDALSGIKSVLVAGSHTAQADFRHYVEKNRPLVAAQIAGWQTVDHPAEGEIVKMAREFFVQRGEMVAPPRMT
ncbi:MAG: hypothetical protein ABI905_01780 [Betaproteobacteria bacterium]